MPGKIQGGPEPFPQGANTKKAQHVHTRSYVMHFGVACLWRVCLYVCCHRFNSPAQKNQLLGYQLYPQEPPGQAVGTRIVVPSSTSENAHDGTSSFEGHMILRLRMDNTGRMMHVNNMSFGDVHRETNHGTQMDHVHKTITRHQRITYIGQP